MIIKQIYQLADGAGTVLLHTNDIIKLTHQARGEQGWVSCLLECIKCKGLSINTGISGRPGAPLSGSCRGLFGGLLALWEAFGLLGGLWPLLGA